MSNTLKAFSHQNNTLKQNTTPPITQMLLLLIWSMHNSFQTDIVPSFEAENAEENVSNWIRKSTSLPLTIVNNTINNGPITSITNDTNPNSTIV